MGARPLLAGLLATVLTACGAGGDLPLPRGDAQRGKVLFAAAAGCGCHTPADGPVGAGGSEIPTPFGTFYGTNITPDDETGIGRWTDEEIDAAIRHGNVRGRGAEAPVMPYYRYAGMSDADAADLIAYLRSLPPVVRPNTPHEVKMPRAAFWAWRLVFGTTTSAEAKGLTGDGVARGRYLVDHVSICGDCHTPRDSLGVSEAAMYLAGTASGPGDEAVPNVTPDAATGIGDWDASDIATLLETGMKPDFDNVQGLMADVIDGHGGGPGYAAMPASDREAIGAYLRTVPPVANDIGGE
jgi:mono/diheme cytochrome c family protein